MTKNKRTVPDTVVSVTPTAAVIPVLPKPTTISLTVTDSPAARLVRVPLLFFPTKTKLPSRVIVQSDWLISGPRVRNCGRYSKPTFYGDLHGQCMLYRKIWISQFLISCIVDRIKMLTQPSSAHIKGSRRKQSRSIIEFIFV